MWKGSIGFGLVNIPVRMYVASEESNIPFVQLDKKTHSRVRYKKVSELSGKELHQEEIVKAYQMGDDYVIVDYVVISSLHYTQNSSLFLKYLILKWYPNLIFPSSYLTIHSFSKSR